MVDFVKKNWQFRDIITEGELNRIEEGVEEGITKAEAAQQAADEANQKADQNTADLIAHLNDDARHVTQSEKDSWNAKVSKSGDTMTGNLTLPAVDGDWYIPDTRSIPINPGDLQRRVSVDFKSGSTIGLSGSTYFVVFTIRPWSDDSGGGAHQVAFGDNGIFHRKGLQGSGWQSWNEIFHFGNQPKITVSSTAPSSPKYGDIWIEP